MNFRIKTNIAAAWLAAGVAVFTGQAIAEEDVVQVLDSVNVNSATTVAKMLFEDPTKRNGLGVNEFEVLAGLGGTAFRTCDVTTLDGLYCLDGKLLKHWPDVETPASLDTLDCTQISALDSRKADTCASLAVSLNGRVWLGGKSSKGSGYSLIELTEPASCPPNRTVGKWCWREVGGARPELVAMRSIDGDTARDFAFPGCPATSQGCSGLLLLQGGSSAGFLRYGNEATYALADKFAWGLKGNESLQDLALLQLKNGAVRNILLATTPTGTILAYDIAAGGTAFPVFQVPLSREATTPCNTAPPRFSIEASSRTGLVYVTDSQYCEVQALTINSSGEIAGGLVVATEDGSGSPLILSTRDINAMAAPVATNSVTVTPGISVDLRDCKDNADDPTDDGLSTCAIILDAGGNALFSLTDVDLKEDSSSDMTLFQVTGVPDCRYIPAACVEEILEEVPSGEYWRNVDRLVAAGIIVSRVGRSVPLPAASPVTDPAFYNPATQRLDLVPLMPLDITSLFTLPPMYLESVYRAQKSSNYRLQLFFGRTEEGVFFTDTFEGLLDVGGLTGSELGCLDSSNSAGPLSFAQLLAWDVAATVSERYASATPGEHVTTLENVGCGSTKTIGVRWSMKPYNLEVTPCTYNTGYPTGNWTGDGICAAPADTSAGTPEPQVDDAVFAKLLLVLFDELGTTLDSFVCAANPAIVSATDCSSLQSQYANAKDKLEKCWAATQLPKTSAGDQNCQSFESQFGGLQSTIQALPASSFDEANRIGELEGRAARIFWLYYERFLPSIPAGAFVEPPAAP